MDLKISQAFFDLMQAREQLQNRKLMRDYRRCDKRKKTIERKLKIAFFVSDKRFNFGLVCVTAFVKKEGVKKCINILFISLRK